MPGNPSITALRAEVARAMRRARGDRSQPEFCRALMPALGRAVDPTQWSKYETGKVDPPAYLLIAAARTAGLRVTRVLDEPPSTPEEIMEAFDHLAQRISEMPRGSGNPGRRLRYSRETNGEATPPSGPR
jgi:hypothetical protein